MSAPSSPAAAAANLADHPAGARVRGRAHSGGGDLGPAAGWQDRFLVWLNRRKRLSALVPVVVLVLGTPHACPFC